MMITSTVPVGAGLLSTEEDRSEPASSAAPLEAGLPGKLEQGPRTVIVQFDAAVPASLVQQLAPDRLVYAFESLPMLAIEADAGLVEELADREDVAFIEDAEKPMEQHLDSATIASRAREVWEPDYEPPAELVDEPSPEVRDPEGDIIDGTDVGIAIVDSGIDATHRDLAEDEVQRNFAVTPAGVHDAGPYTEHASTHGTKVASVAAGTGAASDGERRGAAPGASLYGFATWLPQANAAGGTTLLPAIAFDWILQHGGDQDPPIRVVTNAWTCKDPACGAADGQQAHMQLATELAEAGLVVVFSVGNDAGDGGLDRVSPEAKLPTRGILGVGNADDEEVGARDDCTKHSSSRGAADDPTTWPDLIAPGDEVWSPQAFHPSPDTRVPVPPNPSPQDERRTYTKTTGTSASAAHVAGVAALVLQANATLDAAQVEHILKATADELPHGTDGDCIGYVQADPMHPWDGANFAAGHGLVDALDAVQLAQAYEGIPDMVEPEPVPEDLRPADPSLAPTKAFYLAGDDGLSPQRPGTGVPTLRYLGAGDVVEHTSAPLATGFTTDGFTAELWLGTSAEAQAILNVLTPIVQVERLPSDGGPAELVGQEDIELAHTNPLIPVFRHDWDLFTDPVTFESGDRIRATVTLAGTHTTSPALAHAVLYSDARPFPARIEFGDRVDRPTFGTDAWCIEEPTCTRLGGGHESVSLRCSDAFGPVSVAFTGPAGATATATCDRATATCTVPGTPGSGEIGTCRAESATTHGYTGRGSCSYTLPDGTTGGHGACFEGRTPG